MTSLSHRTVSPAMAKCDVLRPPFESETTQQAPFVYGGINWESSVIYSRMPNYRAYALHFDRKMTGVKNSRLCVCVSHLARRTCTYRFR